MLVHALDTGAFVQVWLAANREGAQHATARIAAAKNLRVWVSEWGKGDEWFGFIVELLCVGYELECWEFVTTS